MNILSAIRGGKDKPTNIMYASNLSWKPTQKILFNLVEQGLLELKIAPGLSKRRYVITEKGVNALEFFEKANKILPEDAYLTHAIPG